jgi:DNA polymerase-3 subunit alpha
MEHNFVHLRLHTEYSMRDGLLRIPNLLARIKQDGMQAVAISDQSNFISKRFLRV